MQSATDAEAADAAAAAAAAAAASSAASSGGGYDSDGYGSAGGESSYAPGPSAFSRRYANIWTSEFMTISRWNRFLWRFMINFEERFERREHGYFYILSKKLGNDKVGQYTFGTLQRVKVIIYRLIIMGLKSLIKRSRFEMNLLPLSTDDLIHRMLHGLLRKGSTLK
jgi:hypothetical protein